MAQSKIMSGMETSNKKGMFARGYDDGFALLWVELSCWSKIPRKKSRHKIIGVLKIMRSRTFDSLNVVPKSKRMGRLFRRWGCWVCFAASSDNNSKTVFIRRDGKENSNRKMERASSCVRAGQKRLWHTRAQEICVLFHTADRQAGV